MRGLRPFIVTLVLLVGACDSGNQSPAPGDETTAGGDTDLAGDAEPQEFRGSTDGRAFEPIDRQARRSGVSSGLAVDLADYDLDCLDFNSGAELGSRAVILRFFDGYDAVGRYDIPTNPLEQSVGASIMEWVDDGTGGVYAETIVITSGWVEIGAIDGAAVSGEASLTSSLGVDLSGTFSAPFCD